MRRQARRSQMTASDYSSVTDEGAHRTRSISGNQVHNNSQITETTDAKHLRRIPDAYPTKEASQHQAKVIRTVPYARSPAELIEEQAIRQASQTRAHLRQKLNRSSGPPSNIQHKPTNYKKHQDSMTLDEKFRGIMNYSIDPRLSSLENEFDMVKSRIQRYQQKKHQPVDLSFAAHKSMLGGHSKSHSRKRRAMPDHDLPQGERDNKEQDKKRGNRAGKVVTFDVDSDEPK